MSNNRKRQMLKEVKEVLLGKVDGVFMAIKRDYTGIVVGQEKGKTTETLPRGQRVLRKTMLSLIDGAESAFKRAVGLETEPTVETNVDLYVEPAIEAGSGPEVKSELPHDNCAMKQEVEERLEMAHTAGAGASPQVAAVTAEISPAASEMEPKGNFKAHEDMLMQDAASVVPSEAMRQDSIGVSSPCEVPW